MRKYEIMFIISPKIENMSTVIDRIKDYISSNDGSIIKEEDMGIRKLGYVIEKHEKGHYYLIQTEIDPKKLPEVENNLKIDEDIFRYLLTVAKH